MADKTKIFAEAVKVFVAPAGTSVTLPASWTELGWAEGSKTKISEQERSTVELDDDSDYKLSIKFKFEAVGLETDLVKIQALEAFEDQDIDFLLVKRADPTAGFKLATWTMIVSPDFGFSTKEPRRLNINASRSAKKLTDTYSEVTGLSGF